MCVEERACLPEDVGGTHGYTEFLIALGNPYHPEHKQWRRWAGRNFDPSAFDLHRVNRRLARYCQRRPIVLHRPGAGPTNTARPIVREVQADFDT
jgi:hypothetical protein